ncbi:uncharacterized protein LOC108149714 isoform X1 [Drosophila elegans]|uniref:uncharacterized protein LOC108149714 isoform X1 n=1 Tax=Drosophila elegans TaxID=30023 RepID=UPI0007E79C7A|nr:uncharacterized protein LOC108149714 isoform X1 [Drosophila elegans]
MQKSIVSLVLLLLLLECAQAAFNCSAPPSFNNFDINTCCRTPELDMGDVPQKCQEYVNGLKSANSKFPSFAHLCYPDCIYRVTGAMVNGKIRMERVKQYLEQHVHRRDQDIVSHIVHSFETCLSNVKGHMKSSNIESYKVLPHGCSPFAGILYSCVNAETFLNCPPKMWKNEKPCNLAKEFAQQCNPLPHVPLPSS